METKDWIYSVGLLLTFGVSVSSLIITIKNRRSAGREHLYKMQSEYFIQLSKQLALFAQVFENIYSEQVFTEERDEQLANLWNEFYLLTDTYDVITPDKILSSLGTLQTKLHAIHLVAIKNQGKIKKEDLRKNNLALSEFIEDMREELGVDSLSDENKNLYSK
ncbi:MAG: hypothetical protein U0V74_01940 [Chitinophagales bacterium]